MDESLEPGTGSRSEHLIRQASYDFERDAALRRSAIEIQKIAGKTIVLARVDRRHIELVTNDGCRFAFYGLIEAVAPDEAGLFD